MSLFLLVGFFFALHFIVPLGILILIVVHLFLLHFSGRNRTRGLRITSAIKAKFGQLFLFKDLVNLGTIWSI